MDGTTCVTGDKSIAMRCPHCDEPRPSYVKDSRAAHGTIRRRRVCSVCQQRFSTIERTIHVPARRPYADDWEASG
jgi:hypothetical protein